MGRYVEGSDRTQMTLLPECLDDYIGEDNPVRVVEAFVEELDLEVLGFARAAPCSFRELQLAARRLPAGRVSASSLLLGAPTRK